MHALSRALIKTSAATLLQTRATTTPTAVSGQQAVRTTSNTTDSSSGSTRSGTRESMEAVRTAPVGPKGKVRQRAPGARGFVQRTTGGEPGTPMTNTMVSWHRPESGGRGQTLTTTDTDAGSTTTVSPGRRVYRKALRQARRDFSDRTIGRFAKQSSVAKLALRGRPETPLALRMGGVAAEPEQTRPEHGWNINPQKTRFEPMDFPLGGRHGHPIQRHPDQDQARVSEEITSSNWDSSNPSGQGSDMVKNAKVWTEMEPAEKVEWARSVVEPGPPQRTGAGKKALLSLPGALGGAGLGAALGGRYRAAAAVLGGLAGTASTLPLVNAVTGTQDHLRDKEYRGAFAKARNTLLKYDPDLAAKILPPDEE